MMQSVRFIFALVFVVVLYGATSQTAGAGCWKNSIGVKICAPPKSIDEVVDQGKKAGKQVSNESKKAAADVGKATTTTIDAGKKLVNDAIKRLESIITAACAKPFISYTSAVAASCIVSSGTNTYRNARAEDWLVKHGFFKKSDFTGVTFSFCQSISSQASGMVPLPDLVLLDPALRNGPKIFLWDVIAHEMTHIKQIRQKGFSKFACEYSAQIAKLGAAASGDRNPIEREAYIVGDKVYDQAKIDFSNSGTDRATVFGSDFYPKLKQDTPYQIVSKEAGLCLYTDAHPFPGNVRVVPCTAGGADARKWRIKGANIISEDTKECMYVDDHKWEHNVRVIPCSRGGNLAKQWHVVGGFIKSASNGECLYTDDWKLDENVRTVPCNRGGEVKRVWEFR